MAVCCNLVGNFGIQAEGVISVTSKGSAEVQLITAGGASQLIKSPSVGTVSLSAYAAFERHFGCPGRAGVTIPWVRKSDCDTFIYLFGGYGQSYISGEGGSFVEFPNINGVPNPVNEYNVISASSTSGPASLYENSVQKDGFGLIYRGLPWDIDTTTELGCTVNLTAYGIGNYGFCRLQSLNIQLVPGQLPVVNMDFIYSIGSN